MKYGVVKVDYFKQNASTDVYICNLGDTCTTKSVEYILDVMDIPERDRTYIGVDDLWSYNGEYLICPINTIFFQKKAGHELHKISENIIPVFLSLSYSDTSLSDDDVKYLKLYEPIGCRDELTLRTMRSHGISAYLNGCMVATFPKREKKETQKKVFFVDVPYRIKKYIPENIKKDIVFIKQEILSDELPDGMTQLEWADSLLEQYKNDAAMIVASRFHAAVLGLALGIPTIVVNESYTYRFSWIRKLLPFYTRNTFSEIDWTPSVVDFEAEKALMIKIAKARIQDTVNKYSDILLHSEYMETQYGNEVGLIDYYDEAIDFIDKNWSVDTNIKYAFWGVNNNAKAIYEYISKNFPNSQLVEIYDSFKELEFAGVKAIKPECIDRNNHYFVFVTTFVAGYVATELFRKLEIPSDEFFICERRYVEERDI